MNSCSRNCVEKYRRLGAHTSIDYYEGILIDELNIWIFLYATEMNARQSCNKCPPKDARASTRYSWCCKSSERDSQIENAQSFFRKQEVRTNAALTVIVTVRVRWIDSL